MLAATMPVTLMSAPVASSVAGITSSRRRCTSASVVSSCGPSVGATNHRTAVPSSLGWGPRTVATAGSAATASLTAASAARSAPGSTSAMRNSGPLNPAPNPSTSSS